MTSVRFPESVTRSSVRFLPTSECANQTESPSRDHARPLLSPSRPSTRVVFRAFRSTTESSPPAPVLLSKNATRAPSGETRGYPSQSFCASGVPTGYSSFITPPTARATASSEPSGDQSAWSTPSRSSRGAPPDIGARARIPRLEYGVRLCCRWTESASSPLFETARTSASAKPSVFDVGATIGDEKTSKGLPSHAPP